MSRQSPDSQQSDCPLTPHERDLGMQCDITRRDFLNTMALGTGAALLSTAAPSMIRSAAAEASASSGPWHPWTGYGGVGDYAISNGNTWDVANAGHGIRDKQYESLITQATSTGETYDLVIVGGGFAGVIAAYRFLKHSERRRSCLLLDNHPIMGGEAKRNEFLVRGHRLMGPQGSNGAYVPISTWKSELWDEVGLPREFEWGKLPPGRRAMEFPTSNYDHITWHLDPSSSKGANHGYFFETPYPRWVTNPWARNFEGTPWPAEVRRDLLRWRSEAAPAFRGDHASLERWLDTLTYREYLTNYRQLHPEVARQIEPVLVSGTGAGCSVSAYWAYQVGWPGFEGLSEEQPKRPHREGRSTTTVSFPGGNDGILRALVKWLNPEVIEGSSSFADVHNGRIRFEAMDRPGAACRMRVGATVVRVAHDPDSSSKPATITYFKEGKLSRVQARTVIWAGSSWTGQHAVQHLPAEYRTAMASYPRSPMLVVNVALDNWRALYRLGYTSCLWQSGFGYEGSIRAPLYVGDHRPPLDPDQPVVFTMYVPFPQPELPLAEQGKVARAQLFGTSYREFEMQIRLQLVKLFGAAGFDPQRDIAGIVLNRWGHAFADAGPGFFFGRGGTPAPCDVLRRPLGNLTFANTEISGIYTWDTAGSEAVRAVEHILAML